MKECFRNWVLTHEKLYKFIVFVVALVAFLAVTAHGCKTMKAEAATTTDGFYYPDLWNEVDWGAFETQKQAVYDSCDNFIVYVVKGDENSYVFRLVSGAPKAHESGKINGYPAYYVNSVYHVRVAHGLVKDVVKKNDSLSFYFYQNGAYSSVIGSTYDYRCDGLGSLTHSNMRYGYIIEPEYQVNAPYVVGNNVNLQNPYLQGVLPYGEALKKSYLELECSMLGDYQQYDEFTVRGILSVNLPTREFFEAFVKGLSSSGNYDFDDIDTVVLTSKAAIEYVKAWKAQTKNCVTYHLPFEYTYAINEIIDGKLYIKFNARQIFDAIEVDAGNSLKSMYCPSDITDLQYTVVFEPLMSGFIDYFEIGAYTVSFNDFESVYGKYVAHAFGGSDNTVLTTYVSDLDVENTPSDEFTEGVQGGLGDATQEYVENLEATIKDLQGRLEQINNDLAAMEGGLDGSALWNGFNSVVVGIRSVGDSVRGVAVVIGNVFSFIPAPITAIMSFTLVAMCVIGIYKALKG